MNEVAIQLIYLVASTLFILALRSLGRPDSARNGMRLAALGMFAAIGATLLHQRIISYEWIALGAVVGALAGYPMGMWVPMTAMPRRIALSHAFGALAATLVGIGEYMHGAHEGIARFRVAALGFEVLLGALTVTGSLMAFGKLQEILPGRPLTFRGQNVFNLRARPRSLRTRRPATRRQKIETPTTLQWPGVLFNAWSPCLKGEKLAQIRAALSFRVDRHNDAEQRRKGS